MRYAIIGLGYIAERHLRAVKETGGEVVLAYDRHETGGILDRYFINAKFPINEKKFFDMLPESGADYLIICTPNEHHFDHIKFGIEAGVKVICEKPLCVRYEDAATLLHTPNVNTILQLRLHPIVDKLLDYVEDIKIERYKNSIPQSVKNSVDVVYNTLIQRAK